MGVWYPFIICSMILLIADLVLLIVLFVSLVFIDKTVTDEILIGNVFVSLI